MNTKTDSFIYQLLFFQRLVKYEIWSHAEIHRIIEVPLIMVSTSMTRNMHVYINTGGHLYAKIRTTSFINTFIHIFLIAIRNWLQLQGFS